MELKCLLLVDLVVISLLLLIIYPHHGQYPQQHMTAPQQVPQYVPYHEESYWDKLSQRKKDVWKFLQSGFIILFAISVHFLIDFLLKYYLQNNDVSFERELLLRILYPIVVVFIAWNIIAHLR